MRLRANNLGTRGMEREEFQEVGGHSVKAPRTPVGENWS